MNFATKGLLLAGLSLASLFPGMKAEAFTNDQNAFLVLGQSTFTTSASATTKNGMSFPRTMAFDSSHNLWVADNNNNRVLEFVPPFASGMNASLVLGQSVFTTSASATTQSGLNAPGMLSFDSSGNLWVTDISNNRVLEFVPPFTSGMNASLVLGQSVFTTSASATTQSGLNNPGGVFFDSSDNLWMADYSNNRVLEFKPPFANDMNASLVLGQSTFTTSASTTTQNGMYGPWAPFLDSFGNLWVSDNINSRVLEFKPPFTSGMNASLVLGQSNFTSGTGATTQSGLFAPTGASFDSLGNFWVADIGNNRVLEFVPPFTSGMNASLVLGQPDFTTGVGAVTKNGFNGVYDVVFDSSSNLWAADGGANRLLEFQGSSVATLVLTPGQGGALNCPSSAGPINFQVPAQAFPVTATLTCQVPAGASLPAATANTTALPAPVAAQVAAVDGSGAALQPARGVTLSMGYAGAALGGADENKLGLARYDADHGVWVPLFTTRDKADKLLSGVTNHLSIFQIMSVGAGSSLSGVTVGPVPLMLSRTPNLPITFRNLSSGARVRVFTLSGELLADMTEDGTGLAAWNAKNTSGEQVASGIYIALITNGGDTLKMKLVVER